MISELVGQIAVDRRGGVSGKDFSSLYGISVNTLIQKFSNQDRLHKLEEESAYHREQFFKVTSEKNELEYQLQQVRRNGTITRTIPGNEDDSRGKNSPVAHLVLWITHVYVLVALMTIKNENASLRELLKTSRSTIAMLQERLREIDAITEREEEPNVPGLVLGNEWKMARRKYITFNDKSDVSFKRLISGLDN